MLFKIIVYARILVEILNQLAMLSSSLVINIKFKRAYFS